MAVRSHRLRWGALAMLACLACTAKPAGPDAGPPESGLDAGAPDGGGNADAGMDAGHPLPVSVVSAPVAKVKNLLSGLPPTAEEVARVAAGEPMGALVDEWMARPEYRQKMLAFFVNAFQQDQWSFDDLTFQFCGEIPFNKSVGLFVQMMQESFARTVLALIDEGKPFTETVTTTRFMLTPALMAAYATIESRRVDDRYLCTDLFHTERPMAVTVESDTPTTLQEVVDPHSPNFMKFYYPELGTSGGGCASSITVPSPVEARTLVHLLFDQDLPASDTCHPTEYPIGRYVTASDFSDWRMVQIRKPRLGELPTAFYDLPAMRAGAELVLRVPRIGFFSTPAFNARWQTNSSNQARVLANQTTIVALGKPIDLTNATQSQDLAALDVEHAHEGSTCYECHQSLDPMRQFFRQTYSLYMSPQDDTAQQNLPAYFAFHGVKGTGDINDFARLLATHPQFASAWVQKLCTYATSSICDTADPEFQRLVTVFTSSNYSWTALVRALFSSPLVTLLPRNDGYEAAEPVFPIARREHLCATLSARLGKPDICALDVNTTPLSRVVRTVAQSWPSGQFSRGSAAPSLPVDPDLMVRGGIESLCSDLAMKLVDQGSAFVSSDPAASIDALVTQLMGLTPDRSAGPRAILQDHFDAAVAGGASKLTAMRSTFVVACESPWVVGIGQ